MKVRLNPVLALCVLLLAGCASAEKPAVVEPTVAPSQSTAASVPPETIELGFSSDIISGHSLSSDTAIATLAFGSCAFQGEAQPIWRSIGAANPDLFLFMGDNVYGDLSPEGWIRPANLTAMEDAYRELYQQPDFAAFRSRVPILATWDDHDYGLNDAGEEFPYKEQSKALFTDFYQVPSATPMRARDGIYQARSFGPEGQRLQIILLDTRWFRSPLSRRLQKIEGRRGRYEPDADPFKTMLGDEQWAWLEGQLRQPAEVRLIISSVQVLADSHDFERWGNLPFEQLRLFELIRETRAKGIIFLSGDRHFGGLYRRDDITDYPIFEITASSLNRAFTDVTEESGPYQLGDLFGPENFGTIEIDWQAQSLDLRLHDIDGKPVRELGISFGPQV